MPRCVASDLGLHCLSVSHKKDAWLKWVNVAFHLRLHCMPKYKSTGIIQLLGTASNWFLSPLALQETGTLHTT